jgi:DNA-binding transcriptional MocR family regulator
LLPQQTIHITSLAKPFNSFIQTCFIIYSKNIHADFQRVIDKAGGNRSSLFIQFATHLLEGNAFYQLIRAKQQEALEIQSKVLPFLDGLNYQTQPTSYHVWIHLSTGHNSLNVVEKLAEKQIAVTGSHECSATDDTGFIRIALSVEKDMTLLQNALHEIRQLLLPKK